MLGVVHTYLDWLRVDSLSTPSAAGEPRWDHQEPSLYNQGFSG